MWPFSTRKQLQERQEAFEKVAQEDRFLSVGPSFLGRKPHLWQSIPTEYDIRDMIREELAKSKEQ